MAAQALGVCGEPNHAFQVLSREARSAQSGYAFLLALNAIRYAHLDDQLTLEDWKAFREKRLPEGPHHDPNGLAYVRRIIDDAIAIWPERRKVD